LWIDSRFEGFPAITLIAAMGRAIAIPQQIPKFMQSGKLCVMACDFQ